MQHAPVSKPDSIADKVDHAYKELTDAIHGGSIITAMNDISKVHAELSPEDWRKFDADLNKKIPADMLPELSILTAEKSMEPHLDNGGVFGKDALATRIEGLAEKDLFEQQMLQYFQQHEYDTASGESGGTNVSKSDLDKDFNDRVKTNDGLKALEKNNGAVFAAVADEHGEVTSDSIDNELQKIKNLPAGMKVDPQIVDFANQLKNDDDLFALLSHNGDRITEKDLSDIAQGENINLADLQKSDKAADPAAKPAAGPDAQKPADQPKQGNPPDGKGDGNGHPKDGDGKGQEPGTKHGGTDHSGKQAKPDQEQKEKTYTVRSGDNLWQIARQQLVAEHHSRPSNADIQKMINEIASKNGITNIDLIRDGQTLRI
jgi:hypothetical protein